MKQKKHLISFILTTFVIGLILLSGPASAIDVNINNLDSVDISDFALEDFDITIAVNDGEFLPIQFTNLIFSDGTNTHTCKIEDDNTDDCGFLTVNSRKITSLDGGYDYGYGYGYNSNNNYGYQDFGYGYGYGSGKRGQIGGSGSGTITYSLSIDPAKLPGIFLDKTINVEARVYGGTSDNYAYFKGSGNFKVTATEVPAQVTPGNSATITYGDVKLNIPKVPAGVSAITVKQIAPTTSPTSGYLTAMGKTYEFGPTGTIFTELITITLTYTDEELSIAGITDESSIKAAYFDTASNKWSTIDTTVDAATNTITFEINHFTEFTLLSDSTPASVSSPSGQAPSSVSGGAGATTTPVTEEITSSETTIPAEESQEETTQTSGEEEDNGMGGVTGAAVTEGLFKTNLSKALAVMSVVILAGLISYFTIYRKKR